MKLPFIQNRDCVKKKFMKIKRNYPIGSEYSEKGVHFRVWAPDHSEACLLLEELGQQIPMIQENMGYFSVFVPKLKKGSLYRYGLGQSPKNGQWYPDPASRHQPFGVEGPSAVIDSRFSWSDDKWPGVKIEGQIIYELHIGTFTQEGTFQAAAAQLEALAELGITTIEIMPVNEFPGKFGWGYDGVYLFAPYHVYGTPEDLKALINKAHRLKIGVILDVVYNHFGPDGNFLHEYTKKYFTDKEKTEWGEALNFDHPSTREFFLTNARYWIEEYHFDGLRVDATPWIICHKEPHLLSDLTKIVKESRPGKHKIVVGENEQQDAILLKSYSEKGYAFDSLWNDDFHHTALVRLKGKRESYYTDYLGSPQEFISSLKYGFLYQGQYYQWQKKKRGSFSLTFPPLSKVIFLENHDQVANSGRGMRLHQLSSPGIYRALTCLLLLGPNTPLLFQGQEFASSSPFYYFADHKSSLNHEVHKGRKKFLRQFPSLSTAEIQKNVPNPSDPQNFIFCKLDFKERKTHSESYNLHKDLIKLRKEDSVFKSIFKYKYDGAVLGADSFLIRVFGDRCGDRLLIFNFGADVVFDPAPEPLLVPGDKSVDWEILFSTNLLAYGGEGVAPLFKGPYWNIPGQSAMVLKTIRI